MIWTSGGGGWLPGSELVAQAKAGQAQNPDREFEQAITSEVSNISKYLCISS